MPSAILHLDTPRDLRALRRRWLFFLAPRRGPDYRFALPQVSQRANAEATALMSRYRKDCGCFAGGLFTALVLLALVIGFFVAGGGVGDIGMRELLIFGGCVLGAAVIGKFAGLLQARVKMALLLGRMLRQAEVGPS